MAGTSDNTEEMFRSAIENFTDRIEGLLWKRWDAWVPGYEDRDYREVIGAFLSRQVTLTAELARNPGAWNDQLAPLILRPMVEALITVGWILVDPQDRAKRYVLYSLGQEKLILEHRKARLIEQGIDPDEDPDIQEWERWLNSQRYTHLTEVNIGDWTGVSLREMADEIGQLDLHRIDYGRWSGATHNLWNCLVRFNVQHCQNALHAFHRVPNVPRSNVDVIYLQSAAEYLDKTFALFDHKTGVNVGELSCVHLLDKELQRIQNPKDFADLEATNFAPTDE